MKSPTFLPTTALALKVTGIIITLLYLLDCVIALSAAKFQDNQWLLTFMTQLVDRGFLPLMGFAFLFVGIWLDSVAKGSDSETDGKGLRLTALLLSSALGLLFLLIVPLYVSTTNAVVNDQVSKLDQQQKNVEGQLDSQLKANFDSQLSQIEQALKNGQVTEAQLAQQQPSLQELRKLKADPKALDAKLKPIRDQQLESVRKQRQDAESQLRDNALKTGMRSGIASLVMAIGYIIIGWTGLRRML